MADVAFSPESFNCKIGCGDLSLDFDNVSQFVKLFVPDVEPAQIESIKRIAAASVSVAKSTYKYYKVQFPGGLPSTLKALKRLGISPSALTIGAGTAAAGSLVASAVLASYHYKLSSTSNDFPSSIALLKKFFVSCKIPNAASCSRN